MTKHDEHKRLNATLSRSLNKYSFWNRVCHLEIIQKSFSTLSEIKTNFFNESTNKTSISVFETFAHFLLI